MKTRNVTKTAVALSFALAFSAFAAPINRDGENLAFFNGKRAAHQNNLNVLDVGSNTLAESALSIFEHQREHDFKFAPKSAYPFAKIALKNAQRLIPEYALMLEKQAQLRGITSLDMIANTINFDLSLDADIVAETQQKMHKGCTSIAFNNGLVGQTIDLPFALIDSNTTWIKSSNFIGLLEDGVIYQGMGKHVGLALNHLGAISYPNTNNDKLVSLDMFFYAASQKNSVQEVIELAQEIRTPIAYNFTVADDKGGYAAINISGEQVTIDYGTEKGVTHTNHTEKVTSKYIKNEADYDIANKNMGWTFARKEAADLFVKYSPELTIEAMQYAFEQRPINLTVYKEDQFVTVSSFVLDVTQGCAYVAPENPKFTEYGQVCFDK